MTHGLDLLQKRGAQEVIVPGLDGQPKPGGFSGNEYRRVQVPEVVVCVACKEPLWVGHAMLDRFGRWWCITDGENECRVNKGI